MRGGRARPSVSYSTRLRIAAFAMPSHCPEGTEHVFVGAGDGPCAILMVGARKEPDLAHYPVSEAAAR